MEAQQGLGVGVHQAEEDLRDESAAHRPKLRRIDRRIFGDDRDLDALDMVHGLRQDIGPERTVIRKNGARRENKEMSYRRNRIVG